MVLLNHQYIIDLEHFMQYSNHISQYQFIENVIHFVMSTFTLIYISNINFTYTF